MSECRRCNATDETQPICGIGDDGLCLVCRDFLDEQHSDVLGERLRKALADKSGEQTSIEVFG